MDNSLIIQKGNSTITKLTYSAHLESKNIYKKKETKVNDDQIISSFSFTLQIKCKLACNLFETSIFGITSRERK